MNTSFKIYITLLALPLLFTFCSKDFLNEVNPNKQTPGNFWISEANVNKGLSAVYNPIRRMSWGYYGGYEGILHYQMRADDMFPTRGEEPSIWETLSFTNTPNTGNGCWRYLYVGIQLANEFIHNAPKVTSMDQTKLSQMLGEAYFIRGFEYFRVRTDFNQGLIRLLPQNADATEYPLSTPEETLDQAISDFKEAKSRLPKTRSAEELGRVTQGAAIAMLGKAYVWKGEFDLAKKEFESIMTDYGYDLMAEYENNFRDDHEFNQESIWEINFQALGDPGDVWGSSTGDNAFMGSVIGHYFGPSLNESGVHGLCLGGGWYKMQPSPYLIRQFIAEPRPDGSDSKWDKRLYTTAFFKYSDYEDIKTDDTFFDGFTFDQIFNWTIGDKKWLSGEPSYPEINGKPGRFLMKKLTPWYNPTGCTMYSNNAGRINNYRIMRFAEVILLHAEACLETNDLTGAMNGINRIRLRAGLDEINLSDKSLIMEELRNQKLLEFAGENVRWDDLVRWYSFEDLKAIMQVRKKDTNVYKIDDDGNKIFEGVKDTQNFDNFQKKHMYFPIPQSEVDANTKLDQKADWK